MPALVLVVDDDSAIRSILADLLEDEGYQVITASDGRAALYQIQQRQTSGGRLPDLILSDIMMPVMDGLELAKKLQKDARLNQIPLILLTAAAGSKSKWQNLGKIRCDGFIAKPFELDEVLNVVNNFVR